MTNLLVAPVLVPLATAVVALLAWRRPAAQHAISLVGAGVQLATSLLLLARVDAEGILALQLGAWPAPFGISFVADRLGAIMVVLGALMTFAVVVYSGPSIDAGRRAFGFHPLLQWMSMGVSGAFLTGDIFNLYVWFEVLLMSSFVLMALGGTQRQLEGAIKYVTLNLISSALFLAAVGILYGTVGTLNMADLAVRLPHLGQQGLVTAIAMLFLVAFGIKAAIFPLFAWLPASYHVPPIAVSALFAGLLTKVGVYALIRVFTLLFIHDVAFTHGLLTWISGLTMVVGVLGAAVQNDVRRILSFHIVSQIGYMLMGLALFTPLALAGSVFYVIHHIIVKTNLFLIGGIVRRVAGDYALARLGSQWRVRPWLGLLFLVPALSLAGIPPFSGFWAKLVLVRSGLEIGSFAIVGASLAVSLLTLFSMMKIWAEAFWKEAPEGVPPAPGMTRHELVSLVGPCVSLAALTVAIGLFAGPALALAMRAAAQLADPAQYVAAVLQERP